MSQNTERQEQCKQMLVSLQHAHLLSSANSEIKIKVWRRSALSTKLHRWLSPILLVLPLVTVSSQTNNPAARGGKVVIPIHAGWQFRQTGTTDWHKATVPGCVHTDLLANNLIEDPFYGDNEKKQQWIDKKNWEYQTTFDVT